MSDLIMYMPVLHQGYINLISEWRKEQALGNIWLLDRSITAEFRSTPEIRAIDAPLLAGILARCGFFTQYVNPLTRSRLEQRVTELSSCVLPNEAISRQFAEKYLQGKAVRYLDVFLRWDEANVLSQQPVHFDRVSAAANDRGLMALAQLAANASIDWWRRIGALVVRDGEVLMQEHNRHVPSEEAPYAEGDPRDYMVAGVDTHIATSLHVEQALITRAARDGIALAGCDLYTTVFPCPMCAKQVAYSGIKRVFFASGHASLDGERILRDNQVELILVA